MNLIFILQLSPDDGYPKKICFKCSTEVVIGYNLKQRLIDSEKFQRLPGDQCFRPEVKVETTEDNAECKLEQADDSDDNCDTEANDWVDHDSDDSKDEPLVEPEVKPSLDAQKDARITIMNADQQIAESTCFICGLMFASSITRFGHVKKKHPRKKNCSDCNLNFKTPTAYERHLRDHEVGKPANARSLARQIKLKSITEKSKTIVEKPKSIKEKKSVVEVARNPNTCHICNSTFSCRAYKYKHLIDDHEQNNECTVCVVTFTRASKYELHMKKHAMQKEVKPIVEGWTEQEKMLAEAKTSKRKCTRFQKVIGDRTTCYLCHTKFSSYTTHYNHLVKDHQQENECKPCSMTFTRASRYERHMMKHFFGCVMLKGDFKCDLCPAVLKSRQSILYHMRYVHLNIRDFACKLCDKKFTTLVCLRKHIEMVHNGRELKYVKKVHSGKELKCPHCDALYSMEYFFLAHVEKCKTLKKEEIEASRKYECEFCQQTYPKFESLRCHYNTKHKISNRYHCTYCDQNFLDYPSAFSHISGHGNNETPRTFEKCFDRCYICNLTFWTRNSKTSHLMTDHAQCPERCPKWPDCRWENLRGPVSYEHHMRRHAGDYTTALCPDCGQGYPSITTLSSHIMRKHAPLVTCDYCGKQLQKRSIKRHLQVHVGAFNYFSCKMCPNTNYTTKWMLDNHNFRVHGAPGEKNSSKTIILILSLRL